MTLNTVCRAHAHTRWFFTQIGRDVISASGMLLMAVAAPLVSIDYPIVYMIVPSLMVFGFSSPLTLTPILPEMGEIVDSLVS